MVKDQNKTLCCPPPVPLCEYAETDAAPAPEVIEGLLRGGEKMLLTGASKSGKSFLLMELGLAIATGGSWLGFPCRQADVTFINVEMSDQAAAARMRKICGSRGIDMKTVTNLGLRTIGPYSMDLVKFRRYLEDLQESGQLTGEVIIIDPIYKLLDGDESSTATINALARLTDWMCQGLGKTVIYSHHHSKGTKGSVRAMDRSSGSGVFARDADAILDLIELEVPAEIRKEPGNENITALRMETVLRDYPRYEPINLFFRYPVHEADTEGRLADAGIAGAYRANLSRSSRRVPESERKQSIQEAYDALNTHGEPVTVKSLATRIGVTERCVRDRLKELSGEFWVRAGLVGRKAG